MPLGEIGFAAQVDAFPVWEMIKGPCKEGGGSDCLTTLTRETGTMVGSAMVVLSAPLMPSPVGPSSNTVRSWQRVETNEDPSPSNVSEKRPLSAQMGLGAS